MKNKKIVLLILGLLILVIALGIWLLQDGKLNSNKANTSTTATDSLDEKSLNGEDEATGDDIAISSEEAVYEEWLAASVITAISLSYPDFELQGIMTETKTGMSEMEQSEGVYIEFASGGETVVIHSKPIEKERTKKGTVDLHEEKLGFATFDVVKPDTLKGKDLVEIDMNSLSELIAESLLVSLYEHY